MRRLNFMWTSEAFSEVMPSAKSLEARSPVPLEAGQRLQRATVSIVSHGHADYVSQLLRDLDATAAARIDKVIVTRNVAEPDVLAGLRLRFPLEVVDNPRPKGYGANHNAAFRRSVSTWFLVLNPDVRLQPGTIATLLEQADAASGVVAPRILEPGKAELEPRRTLLTPFEIMGRWFKPDYDAPRAHWVAGMFMLFRASAFAHVKGFDEKFYMYVEDADICTRMRLAGWKVQVNEAVRVFHDAQRASSRQWRPLCWHWASLLRWWASPAFWRALVRR
jgi:N-acetylglucosaminyl-diphospho-decaprenol L-rhamnosyltransferase